MISGGKSCIGHVSKYILGINHCCNFIIIGSYVFVRFISWGWKYDVVYSDWERSGAMTVVSAPIRSLLLA